MWTLKKIKNRRIKRKKKLNKYIIKKRNNKERKHIEYRKKECKE